MQFSRTYADFRDLGADVWAISPQTEGVNRALAERRSISFPVLADADQTVIRQWGVLDTREQIRAIPYPALFVMARNGRVFWRHIGRSTRDRPTIAQVQSILSKLAAQQG